MAGKQQQLIDPLTNKLINTDKHFIGLPCKKCGSQVRYKKGRRCVQCKRLLDQNNYINNL